MAVAFRASATANADGVALNPLVCNKPTGTLEGDLMFAFIQDNNASTSPTAPSGWTTLHSDTSGRRAYIYYKIAGASEASTYDFGDAEGGAGPKLIGIVSVYNAHATVPIDASNLTQDSSSNTTATGTALTPTTSPGGMLLFFIGSGASGQAASAYAVATTNPSWTEAYDTITNIGGSYAQISMAYGSRDAVTSTGSPTATLAQSDTSVVVMVAVRPTDFSIDGGFATVGTMSASETAALDSAPPLLTEVATMQVPTVTQADAEWVNTDKNVESFTNTDKS